MSRVTASEFISGILRKNITDLNTERTATNWIYPDKPRLLEISGNKNNFPRVAVVEMRPPSTVSEIGIGGTETEDEVVLGINVYAIKDQLITVNSFSENTIYSGETEKQLADEPITNASVEGIFSGQAYTFIKGQDYILFDNNSDGRYDGIQWKSGGKSPDLSTTYTITAIRQLSGEELSKYLAHSIHMYLRDNWREDISPILHDYHKLDVNTTPDLEGTILRTELRVKFTGINIGD